MTKNSNNRPPAFSQKVYGWLLRAYPPAHREAYGPAMAQLFRDQCRDAWNESPHWGMPRLWLRTLPDLVSTSLRERLDALNERKSMNEKIASLAHDRTTPTAVFIRIFLAVFLITVIAATLITFILPESYASTARIKVESEAPPVAGQPSYDPYFIQTEFEIIQSQLVLNPVIDKLELNVDWGKKYFAGQTLKTSQTLEILKQRLLLMPVKNTKLIAITVYGDERIQAAQIANAIAESYRDYRLNSRAAMQAKGIIALEQEYITQEEQIHAAQSDLDALRQQLKIPGDAVASQAPQEQPYWDKKRDLSQLLDLHKLVFSKIETEKLYAQMPQDTLVQITDIAEPGRAPVRPNKPLNIFLGAVAGGFLGLVAGAVCALAAAKSGPRQGNQSLPA